MPGLGQRQRIPLRGTAPDLNAKLYLLGNSQEIDPGRRRPLVLLCPGGGYGFRSFREEEPVAVRLMSLGLQVISLEYAVAPEPFPAALLQLLASVAWAREQAEELGADPGKIAVMGFSAGGHLAASAGVFWSRPHYAGALGLTEERLRPDALILGYPVITSGEFTHEESIRNLLDEKEPHFRRTVSLEHQVHPGVPPTFLWHTWEDALVPVENSLLFASALRRCGVPVEMHLYARGSHGLSLSSEEVYGPGMEGLIRPECAGWIEMAARWLKQL